MITAAIFLNKLPIEVSKTEKYLDILNQLNLWPGFDCFNSFVFYLVNFICKDYIAKKSNIILIKLVFFQVSKKDMFPKLINNLVYNFHICLFFGINQNIVQVDYNKDIKLFN